MDIRSISFQIKTIDSLLLYKSSHDPILDGEPITDHNGVSIIPISTLNGLLRESCNNLLDIGIVKNVKKADLDKLFGKEGFENGHNHLKYSTIYVEEGAEASKEISSLNLEVGPGELIEHLLTQDTKTAISDESGTALENSLRKYRRIKPGVTYEGFIYFPKEASSEIQELILLGLKAIRFMGLNRNRGHGRVEVSADIIAPDNNNPMPIKEPKPSNDTTKALYLDIQLEEDVIINKFSFDDNTIETQTIIPGSVIRAIVLTQLSRQGVDQRHINEILFKQDISFGHAALTDTIPIPLSIEFEKGTDEVKDLFEIIDSTKLGTLTNVKTSPKSGRLKKSDSGFQIIKTKGHSYQHLNRKNKIAGSATEEDGDIFSVKTIASFQHFRSIINGSENTLNNLLKLLNGSFIARIGKKKKYYGRVSCRLSPKSITNGTIEKKTYQYAMALSPLILKNEYGQFTSDKSNLSIKDIDLSNSLSIVKNNQEISYNHNTKTYDYRIPSINVGSIFKLNEEVETTSNRLTIGSYQNVGYGRMILLSQENYESIKKMNTKSEPIKASLMEYKGSNALIIQARRNKTNRIKRAFIYKYAQEVKVNDSYFSTSLCNYFYQYIDRNFVLGAKHEELTKKASAALTANDLKDYFVKRQIYNKKDNKWKAESDIELSIYFWKVLFQQVYNSIKEKRK